MNDTGVGETKAGLPILSFADADAWHNWLANQPRTSNGLWLKIAKQGNAASALTKSDAVDAALAHGWIDGQLDKYDAAWFLTRFTPRRPKGKWSAVNVTRAERLIAEGRMSPAGLAEVDAAKADGRWADAYAPASTAEVPADLAAALAVDAAAHAFFSGLDRTNRYAILYRIHDAKKTETRSARIAKFVAMCADGQTIYPRKRA